MKKVTLQDAPKCLNANDAAFWVVGWNECVEKNSLREWLQHALEEALDMANYLQAAISKLDEEGTKK